MRRGAQYFSTVGEEGKIASMSSSLVMHVSMLKRVREASMQTNERRTVAEVQRFMQTAMLYLLLGAWVGLGVKVEVGYQPSTYQGDYLF